MDELYTDISFIIVLYVVYTFYDTHVLLFYELFSVFQLTFFTVIICPSVHIHMAVQNTGDIVNDLLFGICLHLERYQFVETLCSYDEILVSVISQVTSYSY